MKTSLQLYGRLIQTIRPYRSVVAVSVLAMVVAAGLEPVLPGLLKPLVDQNLIAKNTETQWWVPVALVLSFLAKGVSKPGKTGSSPAATTMASTDTATTER